MRLLAFNEVVLRLYNHFLLLYDLRMAPWVQFLEIMIFYDGYGKGDLSRRK
jgi:hypothetical protein